MNMVDVYPHLRWVRIANGPTYSSLDAVLADGWSAAEDMGDGEWRPLVLDEESPDYVAPNGFGA